MALVFTDGFESEVYSDWTKLIAPGKWFYVGVGAGVVTVESSLRGGVPGPRYGVGAYLFTNAPGSNLLRSRPFPYNSRWTLGFAAFYSAPTLSTSICAFEDYLIGSQVNIFWNSDGNILAYRGPNSVLLATSSMPVSRNVWHFFEIRCEVASAGGYVEIRVDGATVLTYSGNTQFTANQRVNTIFLWGQGGNNFDVGIDDLYLCDGNTGLGDSSNPFIGPVRIQTLQANDAGSNTQFGVVGAASNYLATTQMPTDEDTTYVSGTYPNQDTYNFTDLPANATTVKAVMANVRARKDDAGMRSIAACLKSGATTVNNPTNVALPDSYYTFQWPYEINPVTGLAWTPSDVNGAEFGAAVTV